MSRKQHLKEALALQKRLPEGVSLSQLLHQIPRECLIWRGAVVQPSLKHRRYASPKTEEITTIEVKDRARARFNNEPAERIVWEFVKGPAQGRLKNTCGNPLCINPDHWRDEIPKKPKGHALSPAPTPPDLIEQLKLDLIECDDFADALDAAMELYTFHEIAEAWRGKPFGPQTHEQIARRWGIPETELRAICSQHGIFKK